MSTSPAPEDPRALRGASVRNPRRRQRNDSDGGARTAPRRKRSKISQDAFVAREDPEDAEQDDAPVMNGHAPATIAKSVRKLSATSRDVASQLEGDLVVRGGKKSTAKRAARGDGAQVLTQNLNYSVKSLPSTPRALKRAGAEFRGSLSTHIGQALAITREQAYVWEYQSHAPVTNPRTFDLPFPARDSEPVPCGALVTSGMTTEVGLLLISATTGQVVFHESIDRAASMGLFHERKPGVEGTLGHIFSGEHVSNVTSADSAGFLVTFTSGRIAQLTLRDIQGKPRIEANFLRESSQEKSSWGATFRGFLSAGAWKMDIAAVHTRALGPRGQMQVIAATENGVCKIWNLDWSGRADHRGNIDFREEFVRELRATQSPETHGYIEPVALMDFAIVEQAQTLEEQEVWTVGTDKPIDLLVLVRTGPADLQRYSLVETSLTGNRPEVKQVIPINVRQGSTATSATPKLVLPKPEHTAYVVFEDAVVLVATSASTSEDPEAQLHDASYIQPENFGDAVYLRKNKGLAFLGAEVEDSKSGQASCIAFVQGAGLVKFSAHDASKAPERSQISVKSKIEQAIFYGMLQDNILDLAHHDADVYPLEDVELAVLAISDEVLRSETPFIPTPPTSVESNLERRAQALNALATHLRQVYPPLTHVTMWKLLWDAEKVAAGQRLWEDFERHLAAATGKGKKRPTLLHEVSSFLQDTAPFELPSGAGPDDRVRAMFVSRLAYIDKFLVWAHLIVDSVKTERQKSQEDLLRLLSEADDVWLGVLETAYKFRTDNSQLYNIHPDKLAEGVLIDSNDYQGLGEFWTSSDSMMKEILKMTALARKSAEEVYETAETEASAAFAKRIAAENPRFVVLICHAYQERMRWTRSRGSQRYEEKANQLSEAYEQQRHDQIRALSGVGQTSAAMSLAEKYRDMDTLTEIIVAESQYLIEQSYGAAADEKTIIDNELEEMNARVSRYFNRFQDDWANAFFNQGFSGDQAGHMLSQGQTHWSTYLTRYLQADPSRAKICWINDITSDGDYRHASQALAEAAIGREDEIWNKKVELSMAKLSMLAADETEGHNPQDSFRAQKVLQSELQLVNIQDKLYRHMLPEVLHALDEHAEIELAMERFCQGSKSLGMVQRLLEASLAKLLSHRTLELEELIDALTLMDSVKTSNPDTSIQGSEFYLALQALNAAAPEIPTPRFEMLLQLIWKRALLTSDWAAINKASSKRNGADVEDLLLDTAVYRTLYLGIKHGLLNTSVDDNYVRILSPSECLGAACSAADVAYRFGDDLAEPIAHDNRIEDEKLDQFIARCRVNEWADDCKALVQGMLENEAAEQANGDEQIQETEDGSVVVLENGNGNGPHGLTNGDSHGLANGIKIEEDSGEGELFEGIDESGDVEME